MTYLTIEDSFRHNGDRHLTRAFNHLYYGHPDSYWQGSIDKAIKNYKNADALKLDPWAQNIVDIMAHRMADVILYGIQFTKTNSDGSITPISAKDIYIK